MPLSSTAHFWHETGGSSEGGCVFKLRSCDVIACGSVKHKHGCALTASLNPTMQPLGPVLLLDNACAVSMLDAGHTKLGGLSCACLECQQRVC